MRHTARALVGVMLVGWCCNQAVAESDSAWWPYGQHQEDTASPVVAAETGAAASDPFAQDTPEPASEEHPDRSWMIRSPTTKVSWPRLNVPEVAPPRLPRPQFVRSKSEDEAARNAWAQQGPVPSESSPLDAVTNGARRIAGGTRAVWHRTVDVLTPGDRSDAAPRTAARPAQPSLWKRMFGANEPQDDRPQTIPQWMAQGRPDR